LEGIRSIGGVIGKVFEAVVEPKAKLTKIKDRPAYLGVYKDYFPDIRKHGDRDIRYLLLGVRILQSHFVVTVVMHSHSVLNTIEIMGEARLIPNRSRKVDIFNDIFPFYMSNLAI